MSKSKPVYGPELPPKYEEYTLRGGLTKEVFNQQWMPFIRKLVEEACGVEALL
jgi:hypothetical protein